MSIPASGHQDLNLARAFLLEASERKTQIIFNAVFLFQTKAPAGCKDHSETKLNLFDYCSYTYVLYKSTTNTSVCSVINFVEKTKDNNIS